MKQFLVLTFVMACICLFCSIMSFNESFKSVKGKHKILSAAYLLLFFVFLTMGGVAIIEIIKAGM